MGWCSIFRNEGVVADCHGEKWDKTKGKAFPATRSMFQPSPVVMSAG